VLEAAISATAAPFPIDFGRAIQTGVDDATPASRVKTALDHLLRVIEDGPSPALQRYLDAKPHLDGFGWINFVLIGTQKPDAVHVARPETWESLGRTIRPGEKPITVLVRSRELRFLFRLDKVFDLSQTDGVAFDATAAGDPGAFLPALRRLVADMGINLEYLSDLPGRGVSLGQHIVLNAGLSTPEEFVTLAHELAHEVLHHGRFRPPRGVSEVEAEATSFVISHAVGLETKGVSDTILLIPNGPAILRESIETVREAATGVLEHLLDSQGRN